MVGPYRGRRVTERGHRRPLGGPGLSPRVQDAKCDFLHPKTSVHKDPCTTRRDPVTLNTADLKE